VQKISCHPTSSQKILTTYYPQTLGVAAGHISNSRYKNMNHDISKAKKLLLQLFWSGSLNWQITSQPKILQPFK
jgi:hypothetical protein